LRAAAGAGYVNPVVAVMLGWAVLSEEITGSIVMGSLAILLSVAFILRREHPRPNDSLSAGASAGATRLFR
jgi:drug/metabolite transporter (DMT)-like permease